MKQKIVIKVSMSDLKSRSKAMKIAVGVSGVESASIAGNEKDLVEVVGDGIDAVVLTRLLRKNVAYAELVSVGEVKNQAAAPAEKNPEPGPPQQQMVWTYVPQPYYSTSYSQYPVNEVRDPTCTIM